MATYLDTEDKVLGLEHVEKKQLAHRATDATEVNDLIHNPRDWCSWGFIYQFCITSLTVCLARSKQASLAIISGFFTATLLISLYLFK